MGEGEGWRVMYGEWKWCVAKGEGEGGRVMYGGGRVMYGGGRWCVGGKGRGRESDVWRREVVCREGRVVQGCS